MENNCERKIVETIQRDQKRWNSGPSWKCESPITKLLSLKAFYFEFAFQLLTTSASEQKNKKEFFGCCKNVESAVISFGGDSFF